jgi:hypothetical protein
MQPQQHIHEPKPGEVATSAPPLTTASPLTTAPRLTTARSRRRHPALAGRILATGVGSTAFFGSLAGIAANPPTWSNATSAGAADQAASPSGAIAASDVAPATTVVVERVARTFYVDQAGNPVAAPSTTTAVPAAQSGAVALSNAAASPVPSAGGAPGQATSSTPRPAVSASTPAASPTTAAAPSAAPAAAPSAAPAAPAPTAPPVTAPPVTAPPVTAPPTTAAPAPKPTTPPTTVPACQTSKC